MTSSRLRLRLRLLPWLPWLLLLYRCADAFYLPGVAPTDYSIGDPVALKVNALTSIDSKSLLPFDYYLDRFHFCEPKDGKQQQLESLGAILFGDRLYNSPFEVRRD
jgi:transmembrane 9 superfamily protein 2/4